MLFGNRGFESFAKGLERGGLGTCDHDRFLVLDGVPSLTPKL
jgi:hypothetical protein